MTHNVKSKSMSLICTRKRRRGCASSNLNLRSTDKKLMANKVLKLLKMEAETKANETAAGSPTAADGSSSSSQAAVDSGGGAGAGVTLDNNSDFYNTGRVGRRNALPDILNHHHSTTSTADLPDKLSALSTTDGSEAAAGGSK